MSPLRSWRQNFERVSRLELPALQLSALNSRLGDLLSFWYHLPLAVERDEFRRSYASSVEVAHILLQTRHVNWIKRKEKNTAGPVIGYAATG